MVYGHFPIPFKIKLKTKDTTRFKIKLHGFQYEFQYQSIRHKENAYYTLVIFSQMLKNK